MDHELWRTMQEPDIDSRLAAGLRSNRSFAEWWVGRILPTVKLGELVEIRPNYAREEESWFAQSKAGRETDLHVVAKNVHGVHYAILTESKVIAPPSENQPEDYAAYARWGELQGRWRQGTTVLMAPKGYLDRASSAGKYEVKLSYEEVRDSAEANGLNDLASYLDAGIARHGHSGPARNPDELIGGFRVRYSDLLREEHRHLYECLSGNNKKLFDSSQRWFEFHPRRCRLGRVTVPGVEVIHKICNRTKGDQDRSFQQNMAVHVPQTGCYENCPPNWNGRDRWRKSKAFWILDMPLNADDWLFFDDFSADAARRVWARMSELIIEE
ncbi:MAG: hypothetical protein OXU19_00445 [bacterium]|nr:hypothetical protein [bacterium]MDE0416114.1 hypothetical protein [bacterium]